MLDVKAKKASLKRSFLIQIPVFPTKRVKSLGWVGVQELACLTDPLVVLTWGVSTDYSVMNAAVHDDL